MVATAHPYATEAALSVLEAGGNAVDAAIVAQWVLNVVEPQSSGIGGGGFFLYYDSKTKGIHTFDGREKAPRSAEPEMFLDPSGSPIRFYPDRITGGLPVGVPGTLRLLKEVYDQFGSKKFRFEEFLAPAIRLAGEGFPVSKRLAQAIQSEAQRLKLFPSSREIFFHPNGEPFKEGETLVQKDLARTFGEIQRSGIGVFYEGEIARAISDAVRNSPVNPGKLDLPDLQFYDIAEREAIYGNYRGYDIFTMGPPSSGGVALLEILNILENFGLTYYGPAADSFHLTMEAQKLAFQDRALYLADPDLVEIPLEKLISKEYAKEQAQNIKFDQSIPFESLVDEASLAAKANTSHISICDWEGNIVSYTTTIEHIFGSAMVVPGWGFFLNNELTDFDPEPGKPNSPAPEKRPRSSMTPVIVFKKGEPFLITGSPGGSLIIPIVQEVLMNVIDFGMPIHEALTFPRFAARGAEVEVEGPFLGDKPLIEELKKRGHTFTIHEPFGNAQAVAFEDNGNTLVGASDPRGEGEALGY